MTAEAHPPSPLDGAIPAGTFAIEASAGTGKTYALSALVARHLAETDTTTGSVLVVTYTRAAANELRSRVRNQLIDLGRYLVADEPETGLDPVLRRQVVELLLSVGKAHGCGILLISHHEDTVARIADSVVRLSPPAGSGGAA